MSSKPDIETPVHNAKGRLSDLHSEGIRRRNIGCGERKAEMKQDSVLEPSSSSFMKYLKSHTTNSYWLTRIVLLRYIAFIYCKWI